MKIQVKDASGRYSTWFTAQVDSDEYKLIVVDMNDYPVF